MTCELHYDTVKTCLLVFTYVVAERDKAGFELLWLKFVIARFVEVEE